jgi:uncharacterized protein GlcG (DUF336 family)
MKTRQTNLRIWVSRIAFGAASVLIALALPAGAASAQQSSCEALPRHDDLRKALQQVVTGKKDTNGGMGNNEWATVVDRTGLVCAIAYSGKQLDAQWLGSRVISAAKANTAAMFSLPTLSLSTANLYWPTQPGQTLEGLQFSNPVMTESAYLGPASAYGRSNDPMVGKRIGGVQIFGGGLALYDTQSGFVGAIGLSGDTSCTDHIIAWKLRHMLKLDNIPKGVGPNGTDNIIFDLKPNPNGGWLASPSGYGHPKCDGRGVAIAEALPQTYPVGRSS